MARERAPLWQRVADELRERIAAGQYDDAFPGELQVAREFGISRGTARQALRPLREQGIVTAGRGRKPRIAQVEPGSRFGAIYSLEELVRGSGMEHRSTVLRQECTTEAAVAERLGLDADAPLFVLERVRFADGAPIAHDEVFAPADLAEPLLACDFTTAAFYREYADRAGVVVEGGTEQLEAIGADEHVAALLSCVPGTPLLLIERDACVGDRVVEHRRSRFLGDRFRTARPFGSASESACAARFIGLRDAQRA